MLGELTQKICLQATFVPAQNQEDCQSPRLIRKTLEVPLLLDGQALLVGRDEASAHLFIPSNFVSRRHAVLFKQGQAYFIQDLHSKNGTFINGKRLASGCCCPRPLKNGDRIRFNIVEFLFVKPEEKLLPSPEAL